MMRLVIIAAGRRLQRDCTPTELLAVARELELRKESFSHIPLRVTVSEGSITHIVCNYKGEAPRKNKFKIF